MDIHIVDVAPGDQAYERFHARRTVAQWATDPDDARELLDMLGLVPREGEAR